MASNTPPSIKLNGATEPTTMDPQPPITKSAEPPERPFVPRNDTTYSKFSVMSVPPDGSILTGKQEHCTSQRAISKLCPRTNSAADLKRELISQQTKYEISELSSPTALRRFGAPFHSDAGEVAPEDSELPLLRYIFVHHVRNFPFLDKAKEKEFWQDKLQVVCCEDIFPSTKIEADKSGNDSSWNRLRAKIFRPRKTDWKRPRGRSLLSKRRNWSSS